MSKIRSQDDLVDRLYQLISKFPAQTPNASLDLQQSSLISNNKPTSVKPLHKMIIDVLKSFVDFEQNYYSMRFLDLAQSLDQDQTLLKVQLMGSKL